MQDLVAGQLDFMIDQATNSLPQVNAGKIRAYAVTGKTRLAQRPIFRLWTRPVCRDFMFRSGRGFGHPIERRRTLSPNSMAPWLPLWQVRGFASGLRKSCRRFRRASSRCPRRSVRCRRRRSRSCGRSSRRPGPQLNHAANSATRVRRSASDPTKAISQVRLKPPNNSSLRPPTFNSSPVSPWRGFFVSPGPSATWGASRPPPPEHPRGTPRALNEVR